MRGFATTACGTSQVLQHDMCMYVYKCLTSRCEYIGEDFFMISKSKKVEEQWGRCVLTVRV